MPESNKSNEPSLTQPVVSEAHRESVPAVHSENENSTPQKLVPADFVEIYLIPKPIVSPGPEKEADEPVDEKSAPAEVQLTAEVTPHEQEREPTDKRPLASKEIYEALRKAGARGDMEEASVLAFKYSEQCAAEQKQATQAQECVSEDSNDPEDDGPFAGDEPTEIEPDPITVPDRIVVNIGGRPAKTAGFSTSDIIRDTRGIKAVHYVGTEDGVINQFSDHLDGRWPFHSLYEPLILPDGVEGYRTTRDLFNDILALLNKHVMLPSKECSLLAYWAIATWFTDYLSFLPSVVISGPSSIADLLLRTLSGVCRRPILLGELSLAVLRRLPINEVTPTLLIREPQLSRYTSSWLSASNQPGYLFLSGNTLQELYCPKCIYVGEHFKDSPAMNNVVHINLSGSVLTLRHAWPAKGDTTSFQNRLFTYRLLNHNKVAAAKFRVSGLRPEISLLAEALAAAIVDDTDLQREIIDLLEGRNEQSRVDRATGVEGLVLRAVLFHCHQNDHKKFVREIAATANRFYAEDGESLRVSSETVGHVLKRLGLYSRRLGNAGRGLMFDNATQAQAHRLSQAYDVLTSESSCTHCHALPQSQAEEVVQEV